MGIVELRLIVPYSYLRFMISDKIKELTAAKSKVAELEAKIAAELREELKTLPSRYGFESMDAFIGALRETGGGKRGRSAKAGSAMKKRRKRAVITDETRAEVKKLVAAKKTGAEIAKTLGISLPSVQNIKKALGLVESRK